MKVKKIIIPKVLSGIVITVILLLSQYFTGFNGTLEEVIQEIDNESIFKEAKSKYLSFSYPESWEYIVKECTSTPIPSECLRFSKEGFELIVTVYEPNINPQNIKGINVTQNELDSSVEITAENFTGIRQSNIDNFFKYSNNPEVYDLKILDINYPGENLYNNSVIYNGKEYFIGYRIPFDYKNVEYDKALLEMDKIIESFKLL